MDFAEAQRELVCTHCSNIEMCGPTQMLVRLRQLGMFKRAADPPLDEVLQIFVSSAARMQCDRCQAVGMIAREMQAVEDDWGEPRCCAGCSKPIDAERLEVFPETTHCARCQSEEESGGSSEPEYCPRCGAILIVRQQSGSGVTRYAMFCPECRR